MIKTKKFLVLIFSLLLITIGYIGGSIIESNDQVIAQDDKQLENTINVNGEGTIKVKPDVAYIRIGVETEDTNSKNAQKENRVKMNKILKQLENQSIKEENIRTVEYNIMTKRYYDKEEQKSKVSGYIVKNIVLVTVDNIDIVGDIIDSVTEVGANYIKNITFGTSKEDEYYLRALKLAVKNAENKATAIAESSGVKIEKPYRIIENHVKSYPITNNYSYKSIQKSSVGESTPIAQGELQIKARVNVFYKY